MEIIYKGNIVLIIKESFILINWSIKLIMEINLFHLSKCFELWLTTLIIVIIVVVVVNNITFNNNHFNKHYYYKLYKQT